MCEVRRYEFHEGDGYGDHGSMFIAKDWGSYVRHSDYKRLREALEKIANFEEEPIWNDSRSDAANHMIRLASVALGLTEEE